MVENIEPKLVFTIHDLEALKVIADPLRNHIMETLQPSPLTVNQIAEKLGLSPSKLYYHVNLLEQHGFIRVVKTTVHGNLIEKHYWITALDFDVDKDLLNFRTEQGKENINAMFVSVIDTTREDILRSLQARAFNLEHGAEAHPRQTCLVRALSHISDQQTAEFIQRLGELVKEFEAADDPEADDKQNHALTIALYPSFYYDQPNGESAG